MAGRRGGQNLIGDIMQDVVHKEIKQKKPTKLVNFRVDEELFENFKIIYRLSKGGYTKAIVEFMKIEVEKNQEYIDTLKSAKKK